MRLLVTGVSGFVGSYVARHLARTNFEVVGCHRRDTSFSSDLAKSSGISLVRADLVNATQLPGPFDGVVHVAATSPGPDITVEKILRDNVPSMLALIDAARIWNSRAFILFSSLSVYGQVNNLVVDEHCPIVNPDAYGATKLLSEFVLAEQSACVPGLALRLPGVLGPYAHRNWLAGVASKLKEGRPIQAFHLNSPFNNAAHVADIANLIAAVLQRGWQGFDTVVLGARSTIRVGDAIERLARGLNVSARIEAVDSTKPSFILSSERAIAHWGYDPMEIGPMIDRYSAEALTTVQEY